MNKLLIFSATAIATLGFVGTTEQAQAASFFGMGTNEAEQAQTDFLNATGAGSDYAVEDFEGFAEGDTGPLNLNMGAAGAATLQGSGRVSTNDGFTVDGKSWLFNQTLSENITISWEQPQTSFGFWGKDFADVPSNYSLQFQYEDGSSSEPIQIPYNISLSNDKKKMFFGWQDSNPFTKVTLLFGDTVGRFPDNVGIDDIISTPASSTSTSVPEPGTSGAFWLGILGVGMVLYRRTSKSNMA
jgi:hypothetical protein